MYNKGLRKLRLSLLFSGVVFLVIVAAIMLSIAGIVLLWALGIFADESGGTVSGWIPFLYFAAIILILGTIIAFIFSGRPLRPIHRLMDAADRIAAGDYTVRLPEKGPEEFRLLNQKFNHMAQELESVELLRSDFVGNFSHEFKTPIVSIRGFARTLKWDNLTETERNEYLDIIISESERLSDLSQNVLYLSRIENQAILTGQKSFNLTEQLRLVIVLLDRKLSEKQLEVLFEGDEIEVSGNEEMLKQVWINLLDNAIKFSPEGSTIGIRISSAAGGTAVKITDHGPGIPPEAKPHIFDRFYQGDRSHAAAGNGLGLAIVKKVVGLHGGTVRVLSSDKGSSFEVVLPVH